MATITLGGNEIHTVGELPAVGEAAPEVELTNTDLEDVSLEAYEGKYLILNIFPSVDTDVCAASVRTFNERAADLAGVVVLSVSADLPPAHKRFCANEGITNADGLSTFRSDFPTTWGVKIVDGPLQGLCARAVVVVNGEGQVVHSQQVPEIAEEPDYDAVLATLAPATV